MSARRLGLVVALLALPLVLLASRQVAGQGMLNKLATPTFQTEGNSPVYLSTTCLSSAWQLTISSDTIARSTLIISISSNTSAVCLSSATSSGACTSTTPGVELSPASSFTDYSRSAWYCRAAAGTQNLKGYRTRDKGDYGMVGDPTQ